VFGHLVKLPLEYFEKRHIGSITSSFASISTIQRALTSTFIQAIVDGVMVIGTLLMMIVYSGQLAAITLISVSLYGVLRWSQSGRLRSAAAEQIVFTAKQTTHFYETLVGIQSVRLFGADVQRRAGQIFLQSSSMPNLESIALESPTSQHKLCFSASNESS
jgi:ATP-binding cassette subfamily B protein RaxB